MSVTIDIFKPPKNDTESGKLLAAEMPSGRAWDNKNVDGSEMNKLVKGLSSPFMQVSQKIFELAEEFNINKTQNLLEDWEESVGIPDDCIFTYSDIDDRRGRVMQRLSNVPVTTLAELQAHIDAFFVGHTVILTPASSDYVSFEFTFEMTFTSSTNNKFRIDALISSGGDEDMLECLLRSILPANVVLTIRSYTYTNACDDVPVGEENELWIPSTSCPNTGIKSLSFRVASNHGSSLYTGIRSIEFYDADEVLISYDSSWVSSATSSVSTHYDDKQAFQSLSKTGTAYQTAWMANGSANIVLNVTFPANKIISKIVYNNHHESDHNTDCGANEVEVLVSATTEFTTVWSDTVSDSESIFDGTFIEHVAADTSDDQIMPITEGVINVVIIAGELYICDSDGDWALSGGS